MSEQETQTEDFVEDQIVEQTTQEDDSLTAGDSEQPHEEKVEFNEAQQKVLNDIAAKKAFETREARREVEDLRQQMADMQSKLPVEQAPVVPDAPDPYSDTYELDLQKRDEALLAKARFDAQSNYQQQQLQLQKQDEQRLESEALNKSVSEYTDRAKKLGVSSDELQAAGQVVSEYGINDQVTKHILADQHGPLITKYLSQNPLAMESLRNMPPISAGVFIESEIKPQAVKLKPQTTNTPAPIDTITGAGTPLKKHPALEGVIYT